MTDHLVPSTMRPSARYVRRAATTTVVLGLLATGLVVASRAVLPEISLLSRAPRPQWAGPPLAEVAPAAVSVDLVPLDDGDARGRIATLFGGPQHATISFEPGAVPDVTAVRRAPRPTSRAPATDEAREVATRALTAVGLDLDAWDLVADPRTAGRKLVRFAIKPRIPAGVTESGLINYILVDEFGVRSFALPFVRPRLVPVDTMSEAQAWQAVLRNPRRYVYTTGKVRYVAARLVLRPAGTVATLHPWWEFVPEDPDADQPATVLAVRR